MLIARNSQSFLTRHLFLDSLCYKIPFFLNSLIYTVVDMRLTPPLEAGRFILTGLDLRQLT